MIATLLLLSAILWLLWQAPAAKTSAEEKRELLARFRRIDRE